MYMMQVDHAKDNNEHSQETKTEKAAGAAGATAATRCEMQKTAVKNLSFPTTRIDESRWNSRNILGLTTNNINRVPVSAHF